MNNEEKIIELLTEIRDSLKKPEPKKRKTFVKPSYEDVSEYCLERGKDVNAMSFINFYESKNWMIGKNKMKDWKACVRTWEKNNETIGQRQNTGFDQRSRAQKVSDKLDEIARKDIEQNGFTSELG